MKTGNFKQKTISIISDAVFPAIKFYWFLFRPKIYGIKCVIEYGDEILLVRHTYGKRLWTLPGGGIGANEDLKNAAMREMKEELGIVVDNPIKIGEFLDTSEYVKDFITCFAIKVSEKSLNINKDEILEAEWYRRQNMPPLSDVTKKILNFQQRFSGLNNQD